MWNFLVSVFRTNIAGPWGTPTLSAISRAVRAVDDLESVSALAALKGTTAGVETDSFAGREVQAHSQEQAEYRGDHDDPHRQAVLPGRPGFEVAAGPSAPGSGSGRWRTIERRRNGTRGRRPALSRRSGRARAGWRGRASEGWVARASRVRSPVRGVGGHVGRSLAANQLVEDDSQAVEVAPAVGVVGPARGGLGAHVLGRPQDGPFDGEVGFEVAPTGQAEVGQSGSTRLIDQHVGRLEVAMEDTTTVHA